MKQAESISLIQPSGRWTSFKLAEVWDYRELLYFLIWRDIKVRYKQTALGAAWAVLQPLLTMAIFSVFLGRLAKVPSDGIPYPLFTFAALVPWTFFSNSLTQSSTSVVTNAQLIKNVYFPRLLIPGAAVCAGVLDFVIAACVLFGMMAFYGFGLSPTVLWLPLLLLLILVTSLGAGLWLTAINVQFRDVRYALPFLLQAWMFATPIAYPSSLLPEQWRLAYALNPMVGAIEGFRWTLLGGRSSPVPMVAVSGAVAVLLLVTGVLYFKRMEKTFADVV